MKPKSKNLLAVAVLATADLGALGLMGLTEWIAANLFLVCGVLAERLRFRM
jgi:hypothetical protein